MGRAGAGRLSIVALPGAWADGFTGETQSTRLRKMDKTFYEQRALVPLIAQLLAWQAVAAEIVFSMRGAIRAQRFLSWTMLYILIPGMRLAHAKARGSGLGHCRAIDCSSSTGPLLF